jgi:effector-binding domain-containing protein
MEPESATPPEVVDHPATTTAVIAATLAPDEIVAFFDRSFARIAEVLTTQGVAVAGPAFARYHGPPGDRIDLEVGFPVQAAIVADGEVVPGELPAGRTARLVHAGGFEGLGDSWGRLQAWIEAEGLPASCDLWEIYLTEPSPEMDPADLRTELNWRLA